MNNIFQIIDLDLKLVSYMSKKRKPQDIFHKIQCVLSIVISCIALWQTAQMINISRSMETLAKKQNQDEANTQKLEHDNKELLNKLSELQIDFINKQNKYLAVMSEIQKENLDYLKEKNEYEDFIAEPHLYINAVVSIVPVKYQLDSEERGNDYFVNNQQADYRVLVSLTCINLSSKPISITDICLHFSEDKFNDNLRERPNALDLIPFYFLDDITFIALGDKIVYPKTLKSQEGFSGQIFYECVGKPENLEATLDVFTELDYIEGYNDEQIYCSSDKKIVFVKSVEIENCPGISNRFAVDDTIRAYKNTKDNYDWIRKGQLGMPYYVIHKNGTMERRK